MWSWPLLIAFAFITFSLFLNPNYSDYINEVLHENPEDDMKQAQSDWDEGGLTFIAKSSRKYNWTGFLYKSEVIVIFVFQLSRIKEKYANPLMSWKILFPSSHFFLGV